MNKNVTLNFNYFRSASSCTKSILSSRSSRYYIVLFILFLYSCNPSQHIAFYCWKSVFSLPETQKQYLLNAKVSRLYIRLFDVEWDQNSGSPKPIAKTRFKQTPPQGFDIVPVVYITNNTFSQITINQLSSFAANSLQLVDKIVVNNHFKFNELQIDCDWTETTRQKYFSFLDTLHTLLNEKNKTLSVTIRLHQVKYKNITGIPNADKGMLMYYNMGKISADSTTNSIFSESEAAKYVNYCNTYPLKLDVALPLFSWGIHCREGKVIELLNGMGFESFKNDTAFENSGLNGFKALNSFYLNGYYFKKDDYIKIESVSEQQLINAANQLKLNLKRKPQNITFYHLDSLITQKYEAQFLEKISHILR